MSLWETCSIFGLSHLKGIFFKKVLKCKINISNKMNSYNTHMNRFSGLILSILVLCWSVRWHCWKSTNSQRRNIQNKLINKPGQQITALANGQNNDTKLTNKVTQSDRQKPDQRVSGLKGEMNTVWWNSNLKLKFYIDNNKMYPT